MRPRDHIIAAAMAIGIMALSLTVGRTPDVVDTAEHRDGPAVAEVAAE